MENHHFQWVNPLSMAIFNSYFKLPEGKVLPTPTIVFVFCHFVCGNRLLIIRSLFHTQYLAEWSPMIYRSTDNSWYQLLISAAYLNLALSLPSILPWIPLSHWVVQSIFGSGRPQFSSSHGWPWLIQSHGGPARLRQCQCGSIDRGLCCLETWFFCWGPDDWIRMTMGYVGDITWYKTCWEIFGGYSTYNICVRVKKWCI